MSDSRRKAWLTPGTALLVLACVAVVLAVASPWLRREAFTEHVDQTVSVIDSVRSAAERYREREGRWPGDSPAGMTPTELSDLLPDDVSFVAPTYRLDWNRWTTVTKIDVSQSLPGSDAEPEAAPTPDSPTGPAYSFGVLAGITVHSADEGLLAALLDRYGRTASFVRDSSWTVVLTPATTAGS